MPKRLGFCIFMLYIWLSLKHPVSMPNTPTTPAEISAQLRGSYAEMASLNDTLQRVPTSEISRIEKEDAAKALRHLHKAMARWETVVTNTKARKAANA